MAGSLGTQERPRGDVTASWRLSLLGTWRLSSPGYPVDIGLNGQRLFALLAVRGPCDRSYLSGVLWPDCSRAHSQGNLRATLSRLHRRNLTAALQVDGGVLALSRDVEVDARRLAVTATAVLDGSLPGPGRSILRELAGNELLVGWYEDWVLLERERLRQLRLHALERLSAGLLAGGDAATAVEAALAAVAIEPLRESAHRAVIRAHLAEGNIGEALRQLARLRRLLRDELGVEPSSLVTKLFPNGQLLPDLRFQPPAAMGTAARR